MQDNFFSKVFRRNSFVFTKEGNFITKAQKNKVNINAWINKEDSMHNLGDMLSPIIVEEVAKYYNIDLNKTVNKTKHLYAIGSILLQWNDATVWGSGFLKDHEYGKVKTLLHKTLHKTDVRAVRGPRTKAVFDKMGIKCPEVYGDPAILLPLFYKPEKCTGGGTYIVIPHYKDCDSYKDKYPTLSPMTNNWQQTISKLCEAEFVVCSSLHALILAEAYEIPAVLLQTDITSNKLKFKFDDYYLSTKRDEYPIASTVEEALKLKPTLPKRSVVKELQEKLLQAFPKDLWQ